jgi:hypothetical protein
MSLFPNDDVLTKEIQSWKRFADSLTKQHKVDEGFAKAAAFNVWYSSRNIRDCVKIGRMAKSIEDINFIMSTFRRNSL